MNIPVKNAEENDGQTSEDDVIQLDVPLVEDSHRTKSTEVGIIVVRKSQCHILVEEV